MFKSPLLVCFESPSVSVHLVCICYRIPCPYQYYFLVYALHVLQTCLLLLLCHSPGQWRSTSAYAVKPLLRRECCTAWLSIACFAYNHVQESSAVEYCICMLLHRGLTLSTFACLCMYVCVPVGVMFLLQKCSECGCACDHAQVHHKCVM